ncbi:MAG: hypothetical protein EOP49_38965, partial [Sphingobacteriales bacterium]
MKFPALLLALFVVIISCQKEPDVNLDPEPPPAGTDSLTITYFSPDSVIAGMTIRIGGTGFDTTLAGNIVRVNGETITLVSVLDTLIVAIIPQTATTGKVSITVNGKTISSLTDLVVSQKPPEVLEKDVWIRKSDYPGALLDEGPEYFHSFSMNGKGYYLRNKQVWEYAPESNTWLQKSSAPVASAVNNYGFCITVQDKAYIGLGASAPGDAPLKEVWEYNVTTDQWTRKSDFPGAARVGAFGFTIGATGYIGGGDTLNANLSEDFVFDLWKYETSSDTWTRLKDFPGSRSIGLSGVSIENSGYIIELGINSPTAPVSEHKDIHAWKYDPANDRWDQKARIRTAQVFNGGGTSFVINNKIYVGAGVMEPMEVNGTSVMQNFWMYDPVVNTWTAKKDMGDGVPRLFNYGFAIDGKGYVGLGTGVT